MEKSQQIETARRMFDQMMDAASCGILLNMTQAYMAAMIECAVEDRALFRAMLAETTKRRFGDESEWGQISACLLVICRIGEIAELSAADMRMLSDRYRLFSGKSLEKAEKAWE